MIYVENIKTYKLADYPNATHVYIGRRMPGRPGSPLGNPFKLRFEAERADVLARYETWLAEQLAGDTEVRQELERLACIARDEDLVLACWCAPSLCHGYIVKREIEKKLEKGGAA
jgi:hypothetical protein